MPHPVGDLLGLRRGAGARKPRPPLQPAAAATPTTPTGGGSARHGASNLSLLLSPPSGPPHPSSSTRETTAADRQHQHQVKGVVRHITKLLEAAAPRTPAKANQAALGGSAGERVPSPQEAVLEAYEQLKHLIDLLKGNRSSLRMMRRDMQVEKLWGAFASRISSAKVLLRDAADDGIRLCRETWRRVYAPQADTPEAVDASGVATPPQPRRWSMQPTPEVSRDFSVLVNNCMAYRNQCDIQELEKVHFNSEKTDDVSDSNYAALWKTAWGRVAERGAWIDNFSKFEKGDGGVYYRLSLAHASSSFARCAPSTRHAVQCVRECLLQLRRVGPAKVASSGGGGFLCAAFNHFYMAAHQVFRDRQAAVGAFVAEAAGEKFGHIKEIEARHFCIFGDAVSSPAFQRLPGHGDLWANRVLALCCFDAMLTYRIRFNPKLAKNLEYLSRQALYQGDPPIHRWCESLLFRLAGATPGASGQPPSSSAIPTPSRHGSDESSTGAPAKAVPSAAAISLSLYNEGLMFGGDAWADEAKIALRGSSAASGLAGEVDALEVEAVRCVGGISKNPVGVAAQERVLAALQRAESLLQSLEAAEEEEAAGTFSAGDAAGVDSTTPLWEHLTRCEELRAVLRNALSQACFSIGSSEPALMAGEQVLGAFFRTDPLLLPKEGASQRKNSLGLLHQTFCLLHSHTEILLVRGEVPSVHRLLAQALKTQACNPGNFSPYHMSVILLRRAQALLITHDFIQAEKSLQASIRVTEAFIEPGCLGHLRVSCHLLLAECYRRRGGEGNPGISKILDRLELGVLPALTPERSELCRSRPWVSVFGGGGGGAEDASQPNPLGLTEIQHASLDSTIDEPGVDDPFPSTASSLHLTSSFCHRTASALSKASRGLSPTQRETHRQDEPTTLSSACLDLNLLGSISPGMLHSRRCRVNAWLSLDSSVTFGASGAAVWRPVPHSQRKISAVGAGGETTVGAEVEHLTRAWAEGGPFQGPLMRAMQIGTELAERIGRRDEPLSSFYLNSAIGWTVRHELEGLPHRRALHRSPYAREGWFSEASISRSLSGARPSDHLPRLSSGSLSATAAFPSSQGGGLPQPTSGVSPAKYLRRLQGLLPACYAVVTLSAAADGHLMVGRLESGVEPVVLGIPEGGAAAVGAAAELAATLAAAKKHLDGVDPKRIEDEDYKQRWWATREKLDNRVREVIERVGDQILGSWRGALLGAPLARGVSEALGVVEAEAARMLEAAAAVRVDRKVLRLLVSSVPHLYEGLREHAMRKVSRSSEGELFWESTTRIIFHALHDLLDITPSGHVEIASKIRNIATFIHKEVAKVMPLSRPVARQHVLLVTGALHRLPWEASSALEGEPVSRIPSLDYLMRKLTALSPSELLHREFDTSKVFYMLNPDGNLKRTEAKFDWFRREKGWSGQVGAIAGTDMPAAGIGATAPRTAGRVWREQWLQIVRHGICRHDAFLYMGHGTGEQFVALRDVRRIGATLDDATGAPPSCMTPKTPAHRLSTSRAPQMKAHTPPRCLYTEMMDAAPDTPVTPAHGRSSDNLSASSPRLSEGSMRKLAVCFMMGCSSGKLADSPGDSEPYGMPYALLVAGAPAVVANLWDVTDGEIDRFTAQLLKSWLSSINTAPLTDALDSARQGVKLRYLIGACPVMYGLPVNPRLTY